MASSNLAPYLEKLVNDRHNIFLMSDFDGTLVDLVPDPDAVNVPSSLTRDLLRLAQRSDFSFAIVTGRALPILDGLLSGPITAAIGSHGAELRLKEATPIEYLAPAMPRPLRQTLTALGQAHQCIVEDKVYSFSMHLPFDQAQLDLQPKIENVLKTLSAACHVNKIGRTYEVLQDGINKGSGIRNLMKRQGFAGRKPVYIGDDTITDKSLSVVEECGGMLIPAGDAHVDLTQADDSLLSVSEVRQLIGALAALP